MIAIKNRTVGFLLPVFEGLVDLALAHDQQSFFALDALAAKLYYRFDLDGRVLGVMGRQASGPGVSGHRNCTLLAVENCTLLGTRT